MYGYKRKTQVSTTKYSTPKGVQYRSLDDEPSHPNNRYMSRDDTTSSKSLNQKSKIHYGAIDEKSSNPSYKNNRYTPRDDPPLNYINNYEVKCIYRINMNNYYKNINIYNYKKKFNI